MTTGGIFRMKKKVKDMQRLPISSETKLSLLYRKQKNICSKKSSEC